VVAVNPPVINFTGGILGDRLHNRIDVPTYANGAEVMENFRPNIQGVMSRRPALYYLDTLADEDLNGQLWPFYFAIGDTYLIDVNSEGATFYANSGKITIDEITSSIGSSWTDESEGGALASIIDDQIVLESGGGDNAIIQQSITINETDTPHTLAFQIAHGPVSVRIGTTSGDDDVLLFEELDSGTHYLTFTPTTSTVFLQFYHDDNADRFIQDTVAFLSGPEFLLPTPWLEEDLDTVQLEQIKDVLYLTAEDYITRRIIRRADKSWSITLFEPTDGPFNDTNTGTITIAADDTTGEVQLTASRDLFSATDVGILYRMTGNGQNQSAQASSEDVFTGGIEVTGEGEDTRTFNINITGTFVATVTLQRSSGNEESYTDWQTYTTAQSVDIYDANDNETWFYRLAVKAGDYVSGTVSMEISNDTGATTGIVRVIQYTNATTVIAEVVKTLANTDATSNWAKGAWNFDDGYPASLALAYGRLWFGRGNTIWGSKPDDFTSLDAGEGDRTDDSIAAEIGSPSDDAIRWLGFANHLVIGTASEEKLGLGNTDSDPIGPENFQILPGTEEGSALVQVVQASSSILYVHRSRTKLMQFTQDPNALSEAAYISIDLTARAVELLEGERIVDMAVLREPERRIFVSTESGKMFELLFRREGELDIVAWSRVRTSGRIEKMTVLPRNDRDVIYCRTRRRGSDSEWQRFIEEMGTERPIAPDDYAHLDNAISYNLEKPNTTAEVSGKTGSITVTTDADVFDGSDVNAVIWINGGRGTITAVAGARSCTVNLTTGLVTDDIAASGTWGFNPTANIISGLSHLDGLTVSVFGDGLNLGEYTVADGEITLSQSVSWCVVGLPYSSKWKSLKLAYGSQKGTALTMPKAIKKLVLLLFRSHPLKYGPTFEKMWPVKLRTPSTNWGEPIPYLTGETEELDFDGGFDTDARLCLEIDGAGPCTIAGIVPRMDTRDR
jgi:hypothetical protein